MASRKTILENIGASSPDKTGLPAIDQVQYGAVDHIQKFRDMAAAIGARVMEVAEIKDVKDEIEASYPSGRIVSTLSQLPWYSQSVIQDPHTFENVELAIIDGHFGVAENGAVWLTDTLMGDRALPFIVQHLALVLDKTQIVPTLSEAYDRIASLEYDFGVFIAGPSKTADIEQSLVFGAHGPKSLTIFLIG
jgi:L-lactate dehydrogenase complex protein LldG